MADSKLIVNIKEAKLGLAELLLLKIFRLWERSNPSEDDEPFFKPKSVTVGAGATVNTDWLVPKDSVWYLEEASWTYFADSEYSLNADSGALTFDKMDFAVQPIVLNPPYRAHTKIRLKIKNSGTASRTYNVYIKGWRRFK